MSIGRMGRQGKGKREKGKGNRGLPWLANGNGVQSRTPFDLLRGPPPSGREAFFLKTPYLMELSAKQTEGVLGV